MLFIIGCALEAILCILSLFVATFYSQSWGYGKVFKEKAVSLGNKDGWTLGSQYGLAYGLLIGVVILTCIVYLVMFITKHENLIPRFIMGIVFIIPAVFLITAISTNAVEGQFSSIGFITIGAGVKSGLTNFGFLFIIGNIVAFVFVCKGMKKRAQERTDSPEKKVSEIKVKKIKVTDENVEQPKVDEWKL